MANDQVFQNDAINFVNGINIAWVAFGRDVGKDPEFGTEYRPDMNAFNTIMDAVVSAGGNMLRWWYHTNGSVNPTYDNTKKVTTSPDYFHDDVQSLLDMAVEKGLKIQICLWSFDMLKDQWNVDTVANKKLLTEDEYLQAYLDNALLPLVNYIGEHPGLYAWEIFNEPEGMTTEFGNHWTGFKERISMVDVQRFINKTSAAIRNTQPNVKITNGALGFLTSVEDPEKGYQNYYSDKKLQEIGGESNGYLDFYTIHYYNWAGKQGSPFHNLYDPEKIDKKAVIAEYYPDDTFGIATENLGINLIDKGWHGSLVWSWTDKSWDIIEPIILNISNHIQTIVGNAFEKIKMFPNPTNGEFHIAELPIGTKITIIDSNGKKLMESSSNNDFKTIDITNFSNGIYYVKFDAQITKKIVKY